MKRFIAAILIAAVVLSAQFAWAAPGNSGNGYALTGAGRNELTEFGGLAGQNQVQGGE